MNNGDDPEIIFEIMAQEVNIVEGERRAAVREAELEERLSLKIRVRMVL